MDTGTVAAVKRRDQEDRDGDPADYARVGGDDGDLDDIYAEPGEIVDEDLG